MLFKSYHDGSMAKALVLGGGGHEFKPALCPSHIHFAIQCMVQTFACNVDLNFGIIYSSEIWYNAVLLYICIYIYIKIKTNSNSTLEPTRQFHLHTTKLVSLEMTLVTTPLGKEWRRIPLLTELLTRLPCHHYVPFCNFFSCLGKWTTSLFSFIQTPFSVKQIALQSSWQVRHSCTAFEPIWELLFLS